MSLRFGTFYEGGRYHVFNRSVEGIEIFKDWRDLEHFYDLLELVATEEAIGSVRDIKRGDPFDKKEEIEKSPRLVTIEAFSVLPNHFHLLLRQECENGVSRFMQKLSAGYGMYFNKRYDRFGSLWSGRFKYVEIRSDQSYLRLGAYISRNLDIHQYQETASARSAGSLNLGYNEAMNCDELIFLDTETTGTDMTDRVCQVAYEYQGTEYNELFKPPLAISVDAMAVSHITNKMVEDKPVFEGSTMQEHLKTLLEQNNQVLVAHNARFDINMLAKDNVETIRFIDTLKIAQYLDPNGVIPRYSLQYLRYYLDLDLDPKEAPAHDALGDIRVLVKLFERLYGKMSDQGMSHEEVIAKMEEVSQLPTLIKKINFGKHKGKSVEEVAQEDRGYLEWLRKQKIQQREEGNPDEDWEFTLKHYLG